MHPTKRHTALVCLSHSDIDVSHDDVDQVLHKGQNSSYNLKTGPLWKVRMVNLSPDHESPRGIRTENQSVIIFEIHHAITDGTTNLTICKELIDILNDLMKGNPVRFEPYSLSFPHAEKLVTSTRSFQCKYFLKRSFKVGVRNFNKKTTFNGVLPLAENYEVESRYLGHVFSTQVSQQLITKCKQHKVSVHSCIVTAANSSFFDLAMKKFQGEKNKINVYYVDNINLRRFYPKCEKEHIGCHITFQEQKCGMSREERQNFCLTAKNAGKTLHESLADKSCLNLIPIVKWATMIAPLNIYFNKKKSCNKTDSHYITTNMGDVTKLIGDCDPEDPIQVTDLYRSTSGELGGALFTLACHTFRKKLYLSIDYYSNKITDEVAEEYFGILKENIYILANSNT